MATVIRLCPFTGAACERSCDTACEKERAEVIKQISER